LVKHRSPLVKHWSPLVKHRSPSITSVTIGFIAVPSASIGCHF
jgi:hypothetical protein